MGVGRWLHVGGREHKRGRCVDELFGESWESTIMRDALEVCWFGEDADDEEEDEREDVR